MVKISRINKKKASGKGSLTKKVTPKKKAKAKAKAPRKRKSASVFERIQPVSERDPYFKVVIYGHSATGKTTFASTAPKPMLIIKADDEGTNSVFDVEGIDEVTVYTTVELVELLKSDHLDKYASICLDNCTSLQGMVLREILGLEELPAQLGWGIAQQQDWQQCTLQTKEMLRHLMGLSYNRHILIIAQEREFESQAEAEGVLPNIAPSLTPSTSYWLSSNADMTIQTFKRQKTRKERTVIKKKTIVNEVPIPGKVEYCARTGPHSVFFTKFRIPKGRELPECITDPTFDKLLDCIKGN